MDHWHEFAVVCGSKRKAEGLVHDHALRDPLCDVAGSSKSIAFALAKPTQPPGVKRGKWRLSLWLRADRAVPDVAEKLAQALSISTGLRVTVVGKRTPAAGAMTLPVRGDGDDGPWIRPRQHRKPYADEQLARVLSLPPTWDSVRTMAVELERTEDAIAEIYRIASMQRGHLSAKMARGRFWRQVRRVAGKLGWLTVGTREYEDLLRDVKDRRRESAAVGLAFRVGRRTPGGGCEAAFDIAYRPPDGFILYNVVSLSSSKERMIESHFGAERNVAVGGVTEDGAVWDGVARRGPGGERYFTASVYDLGPPFRMMGPADPPAADVRGGTSSPGDPDVPLEEIVRRIEQSWETSGASQASEKTERPADRRE